MAKVNLLAVAWAVTLCSLGAVAQESATVPDSLPSEVVRAVGDALTEMAVDENAVAIRSEGGASAAADEDKATQEMRAALFQALGGSDGGDR